MTATRKSAAATSSERIAADLEERIRRGELQDGERLPPEKELARQYDVSRTTLRQALSALRRRSMIVSRAGLGSFIAYRGVSVEKPEGWTAATAEADAPTATEVILIDRAVPPVPVEGADGPVTDAYRILRRRLAGGRAVSVEETYLPAGEMLDLLMEHGLLGGSVSKTMKAAGMVAVSGEQDVTARPLPPDFARLLDTEPGTVFLHTTRVNSDADGRVVEIVISYLDPQCFSLHLTYGK